MGSPIFGDVGNLVIEGVDHHHHHHQHQRPNRRFGNDTRMM